MPLHVKAHAVCERRPKQTRLARNCVGCESKHCRSCTLPLSGPGVATSQSEPSLQKSQRAAEDEFPDSFRSAVFLGVGLTNENGIVAQELRTPAWHNGDLFFRHQIILMLMLHVDQGSRCTTFADLPRPPLQRHVLAAWGWHGARCAARCAARSAVVQAHQPSQLKSCFSRYLLLTSLLKDAFLGSGFRSIESRLTQTRNLKSDRRP